jgi:hypothetical protein
MIYPKPGLGERPRKRAAGDPPPGYLVMLNNQRDLATVAQALAAKGATAWIHEVEREGPRWRLLR